VLIRKDQQPLGFTLQNKNRKTNTLSVLDHKGQQPLNPTL